jgi:hypothetical protein
MRVKLHLLSSAGGVPVVLDMKIRQNYHGWLIDIVGSPIGYSFYCWHSDSIAVSDYNLYPSLATALNAAHHRADLESACTALVNFLAEIRGHCYYLGNDDYEALTYSIVECSESACLSKD